MISKEVGENHMLRTIQEEDRTDSNSSTMKSNLTTTMNSPIETLMQAQPETNSWILLG